MLVRKRFRVVVLCMLAIVIFAIVRESPKCDLGVRRSPMEDEFDFVPAEPSQTDVIIRSVYFNDRPQNGYENTAIFLLEVNRSIWEENLIVACGVGSLVSYKFQTWPCGDFILHKWICKSFPNLIQGELMVHCYDLPVHNGSTAFIIYKLSQSSSLQIVAQSPHRLMIPGAPQSQVEIKIVTCSRVFNRPLWLVEWLRYQKTIGVDHVHIITDAKADELQGAHFKQAVKSGFVSVEVWQHWQNDEIYEALAYEDCIYRFRGAYDYAFVLDTDDYFIPVNPSEKRLHYYVDKWCKYVASCAFSWIEYYPACGVKGKPTDGNVTAELKSSVSLERKSHKFLHRLSDIDVKLAESVVLELRSFQMNDQHGRVKIPSDEAYVAHHRKNKLPAGIVCA